jgi:hypothetical protein
MTLRRQHLSRGHGRAAVVLMLAVPMTLLAACGGSSSSPTRIADSPSGLPQASRGLARATPQTGVGGVGSVAPDPVSTRPGPARARAPYPGTDDDEVSSSAARPLDPCTLVTRSEARAIVGRAVSAPVKAPQGPTCIYQPQHANSVVAVSVRTMRLSAPRQPGRGLVDVTLRGHKAYCLQRGSLILVVPLSGDRALNVAAPCQLAARFATAALSRLPN